MPADKQPSLRNPKKRSPSSNTERSRAIKRAESGGKWRKELSEIEELILSSPVHYNKIATLSDDLRPTDHGAAKAVTLCRIFCHLIAAGRLTEAKGDSEDTKSTKDWLRSHYEFFCGVLCEAISEAPTPLQAVAVGSLMMMVKKEAMHMAPSGDRHYFPRELFAELVCRVLATPLEEVELKQEFVTNFVNSYGDIQYYFLLSLSELAREADDFNGDRVPTFDIQKILDLLLSLESPMTKNQAVQIYYTYSNLDNRNKKPAFMHSSEQCRAWQQCWLNLLGRPLTKHQRKQVLNVMSSQIAPSFLDPKLLMDFLVECYDMGGSTSLLALNGLYYLISEKNLDYPNFYQKLYALLNSEVLHMRHRSRFFRLLETFLSSTHLPAALVASFIKRMARLCLSAPPAAILVIVPFIYNLFKTHRSCTYMMHRTSTPAQREKWRRDGFNDDPFNEHEQDPMQTGAINSSIWELEMLASHWHPNVATLCKIIGQQFTRQSYNLEDFLDHSYGSMFATEIERPLKTAPAIEYEVPKRVLSQGADQYQSGENGNRPNLTLALWDFT